MVINQEQLELKLLVLIIKAKNIVLFIKNLYLINVITYTVSHLFFTEFMLLYVDQMLSLFLSLEDNNGRKGPQEIGSELQN